MIKTKINLFVAIVSIASLIAGCKGKDGDPGPAGTNGTNGTTGTNGTNGTNGTGFDEATKNGNIMIYLDGTRPDGIAFKDTLDFRFCPTNVGQYSVAYTYNLKN